MRLGLGKRGVIGVLVVGVGLFFAGQMGCKNKLNVFTIEQDKEFGQQLVKEIESKPAEYPLVSRAQMPEVYAKLEAIRDAILASGQVKLKDKFDWEVRVINADMLNAFCAPGGYIYFYTGILKFLDTEAEVAGVMGHEMAHADCRHSTKQLTTDYGMSTLLGILIGDNSSELTKIAAGMAKGLAGLRFSRTDEMEADRCAVYYLSGTKYNPGAVAGFFEKLQAQQSGSKSIPEFLSTHPDDAKRIAAVKEICSTLDSSGKGDFRAEYQEFKLRHLK